MVGLSLGFRLINLIIPANPDTIKVVGKHGNWIIQKDYDFHRKIEEIKNKPTIALETYTIEHEKQHSHAQAEELIAEFQHICLCLSYLFGSAVTFERSLPFSDINFIQVGDGFPRMRHFLPDNHIVVTPQELEAKLNKMISLFDQKKLANNIHIIIHHFLDSNYCWSLEDLFLDACTVLEIVKQNEIRRQNRKLKFYKAIESTSQNLSISIPGRDFIKMRNDLIHEGHLSKTTFPGHTKSECADVVCGVLNWIDEYVHSVFMISPVSRVRYPKHKFDTLNSYTTW